MEGTLSLRAEVLGLIIASATYYLRDMGQVPQITQFPYL